MDFSTLHAIAHAERQSQKPVRIRCCTAAHCWSAHSQAVKQELAQAIAENGFSEEVEVQGVGCMGLCGRGPLVQIDYCTDVHGSSPVLYENVTVAKAPSIVNTLDGGRVHAQQGALDHPFFTSQQPIVLENSGTIDPERIEAYIAAQGYQALHRMLSEMSPTDVINAIARSGLRGRGGSGYPTGLKWATVAKATGAHKFILCQTDQADPEAFLDRTILESDPHRILEGLAIAAYAVGADQGYIYIRPEYPLTISRLQLAIHQAQRLGLLGDRILGSAFNFHLDVRMGTGPHSIVETAALITRFEDLHDFSGSLSPPPVDRGLWGYPTLTNHVETLGNIAPIIRNGADWFARIGTETSKGTKVLALDGAVQQGGLIEVPMGTTLRHIVEEMGGGLPPGSTLKAMQISGPGSGCIPASLIDTPIDYEALAALGTRMGAGNLRIMDQTTNMVDVARYFVEFCMDKSCGQCIPCRVDTVQIYHLLTKIRHGQASPSDLALLEDLCDTVRQASLCGLGQSAPNPVLSTLRYFHADYDALLQPAIAPIVGDRPHTLQPRSR